MTRPGLEGRDARRLGIAQPQHSAPRPRVDTDALKQLSDLPAWLEAHWEPINREGYTRCPNQAAHKNGRDEPPHRNCYVYPDHVHCFACDYDADMIRLVLDLGHARPNGSEEPFLAAVRYLEELTGSTAPATATPRHSRPTEPADIARACKREPVAEQLERRYWERVRQQLGETLPPALAGRGFQPEDRATLGLSHGNTAATCRDGFFPTLDPRGLIVTVRRRFADPGDGPKYKPAPGFKGDENPAWCSPCVDCGDLLIVEGELNGMAAWLALDGQAAVMGMNATTGRVWYEAIPGRDVYVYGDDGAPGQAAKRRWARTAHHAGARTVHVFPAWPDGDACDIAGHHGRPELRARLS